MAEITEEIPVGEFKARFSELLDEVREGRELVISFGRKREKVAVIIPYERYRRSKTRKLGVLRDTASFQLSAEFEMSDEELLG